MNFLNIVYPDPDLQPNYICIDKACPVLRAALTSGHTWWNLWKLTTRLILDAYHYINHCVSDYLCCTYWNPALLDGSAPDLVHVEADVHGQLHYKRAFNTQVSGR